MSVRIRLQRHGRRKRPYYHIVAADQRSKRDGRIIERIGSYDPTRNPAFIDLNFDKALNWVQKGAQATDTCRAILSYKGVLMRDHLNRGVTKGAMTQDQADAKFKKWLEEKENLIESKRDRISKESQEARDKALKAEKEIREKREAEIAERQAEERKAAEDERAEKEAAEAPEPKAEEPKAEEPKAKAEAEEPKAEEPKAKAEEPKAEEPKAEEGGEEKKDEKSE